MNTFFLTVLKLNTIVPSYKRGGNMDTDIHEFDLCFYAGELVIEDVPAKWNVTFVNEG